MNMKTFLLVLAGVLLFAEVAVAGTSVNFNANGGESGSMAYGLNINQSYEPLVSGSLGELTPTAELGGHLWVPKHSDDDNVWGISLAPGLKFIMFTDAAFNPYIAGSIGGIAVSDKDMGSRKLGSNVLFKTKGVVGVEFGENNRHHLQGEYNNYSTWGITKNDDGYRTWGASYGYSF